MVAWIAPALMVWAGFQPEGLCIFRVAMFFSSFVF
jgi:hypothetical protein